MQTKDKDLWVQSAPRHMHLNGGSTLLTIQFSAQSGKKEGKSLGVFFSSARSSTKKVKTSHKYSFLWIPFLFSSVWGMNQLITCNLTLSKAKKWKNFKVLAHQRWKVQECFVELSVTMDFHFFFLFYFLHSHGCGLMPNPFKWLCFLPSPSAQGVWNVCVLTQALPLERLLGRGWRICWCIREAVQTSSFYFFPPPADVRFWGGPKVGSFAPSTHTIPAERIFGKACTLHLVQFVMLSCWQS